MAREVLRGAVQVAELTDARTGRALRIRKTPDGRAHCECTAWLASDARRPCAHLEMLAAAEAALAYPPAGG